MSSDNENRWSFVYIGQTHLAPLCYSSGADILVIRGDVASYSEASMRSASGENLLRQFGIAVGCLDKYLRLMLACSATLQSFDCACAVWLLHWEIAIEGE